MIKLVQAFRRDAHTVHVMYRHNERRQDFIITWSNIDEATGEVSKWGYDLEVDCFSPHENLNEIVCHAISKGESNNNEYIDLYLCIRDIFDRTDCEEC